MKKFLALSLGLLCFGRAPAQKMGGLEIGAAVPNFQLTNQDGATTRFTDYRGKVVIVSFLFTRCPDPSKCPMLSAKLGKVQELIGQMEEARHRVQILSITLDPKNDTPEVLKGYAQGHHADNWTFLTGKSNDILKVAGLFGEIYYDEKGTVVHNTRTSMIDPRGRLRRVFTDNDWKMSEMTGAIRQLLDS
ncbi:MAG: SCO family protein [Candidatus Eremiobacteraeota bacterium]|nr:SCO family protein [Candidatus Eremiobacteraeota bacterium]MCW5872870.1 SCO family protein [Candidatus Eremiobacteraeota bacterium]